MVTDRKLIDYLPLYMQEYLEMQKIMETEQVEIDDLWTETGNVLDDQFVMDATENGVKRWESMLGISPKGTDTLDERKFRILTQINQELPYTITRLKEALTILCGADGFSIDLKPNEYHIEVKLALVNKNNYLEVVDLVNQMIPANLTQYVRIMYNTHETLAKFTHAQLSAYTHKQLREDVIN